MNGVRHFTTLLIILVWLPVEAQTDTLPRELGAVVVTATRLPVPRGEVSPVVQLLDSTQLRRIAARSMAEALIGVPGVWMQKTNHAGGSPFVRGLTGNQVLLLYDGIRMNNTTYRYGPNQYFNTVDPFAISRVEVLPGAGAVLYGSDALGGTINLVSHSPVFTPPDSTRIAARLLGGLRSRGLENILRGELAFSGPRLGGRVGGSLRSFGDLVAGGDLGLLAATGYGERAADVRIGHRPSARQLLTLAYNVVEQTGVGRYDQVVQRGYERYDYDPQRRDLGYLRWEGAGGPAWLERWTTTVARQASREVRYLQRRDSVAVRREEDLVDTYSFTSVAGLRLRPAWTANVGVDTYHDRVRSGAVVKASDTAPDERIRGLYPDRATAASTGIFVQQRYLIGKFALHAGLRYEGFGLRFQDETFGETNLVSSALVYNVAVEYRNPVWGGLRLSLDRGFRAPNINDLSSFGVFDFGIEVPSPGLRPESGKQLELAYGVSRRTWQLRFAAFRHDLSNLIQRIPASYRGDPFYRDEPVYQKSNTGDARLTGGEIKLTYAPHRAWQLSAGAAYTYGTADDSPLRRVPPLNGQVILDFTPEGPWFGTAHINWAAAQRRLSDGDVADHRIAPAGTPGWSTVQLRFGYRQPSFRLMLLADNLLDSAYRIHGSGVDGAGRHVGVRGEIYFVR